MQSGCVEPLPVGTETGLLPTGYRLDLQLVAYRIRF